MLRIKAITKTAIVALTILLGGCSKSPVFSEFKSTAGHWHQDSIMSFQFDVDDVDATYQIALKLRHNADYAFQNLYIFRTIQSANGVEFADTANLIIADNYGKWLGSGVGELKTLSWGYSKKSIQFKRSGTFVFTIQHGMRDTLLTGVTDVGLEIFKANKE